jgi:hypothetical protein
MPGNDGSPRDVSLDLVLGICTGVAPHRPERNLVTPGLHEYWFVVNCATIRRLIKVVRYSPLSEAAFQQVAVRGAVERIHSGRGAALESGVPRRHSGRGAPRGR